MQSVAGTKRGLTGKVLVIGGGVAGTACAITLARLGVPVQLVERCQFPRNKVCGCCLGPAGLKELEALGAKDAALGRGVAVDRWVGSIDGRHVNLAIPRGLAIARTELDPMLLQLAQVSGATVQESVRAVVRSMDRDGVDVDLVPDQGHGEKTESRFDVVVVAGGLNSGIPQQLLSWTLMPSGPFGASLTARVDGVCDGTIYMCCDARGYVGLVRLADGSVDIAAALREDLQKDSGQTPMRQILAMIESAGFPFSKIEPMTDLRTTARLRRRREVGNGRLIAIGDAATYIEPFTGEGMTWAMSSGIAAAGLIASSDDFNQLGDDWRREFHRRFARKQACCTWIANLLESPWKRRLASDLLVNVPSLSRPLLGYLNRT